MSAVSSVKMLLLPLLQLANCLILTMQSPLRTKSKTLRLDPYPNRPKLLFHPNGTFKLTVFSDLHYGENPWDVWGPQQDANSTRLMNRVLKEEVPDYVVLNGDLITGENTFKENSTLLIDEIVAPLNAVKVPFSSTYGNHDNQVNITHVAELERELQVAPLSYTRPSPPGVGGPGSAANYWVPVYASPSATSPSLIMWFFDSQGGFNTTNAPLPDWVDSTVSTWISQQTALMQCTWSGTREHIVFVHIPPFVIEKLQVNITPSKNPGLNADVLGDGSVQSSTKPLSSCGNECDVPFYDAVVSNLGNNGIISIVSGHDHGNEWCALETSKNVVFCFDKHSGYGGYSSQGWDHGVRNFVFTLPTPDAASNKLGVESWIRYEEGEVKAQVKLEGQNIIVQSQ